MSSDLSILSGDFLGADGPGLSRANQDAKRLYKKGRLFREASSVEQYLTHDQTKLTHPSSLSKIITLIVSPNEVRSTIHKKLLCEA